jgi:multidrug resistance efflux pump
MLLPNEWIENSIETYIYHHTTKSQIIYWIVLASVTIALVSLPFIYVDISVSGSGIVRPTGEKAEIVASVTEIVDTVFVQEGEQIQKGDTILRFQTNNTDYKIIYQSNRLNDCKAHLSDLIHLSEGECPPTFHSPVRQQEYSYFIKKRQELETALAQADKEFERNKSLYEKKVISEEEYDSYYFKQQSQQNELASLVESQLSSWQSDLNTYRNSLDEMNTLLKQEMKEKDLFIVRSPVAGTIDQFSGIYKGSSIQAGQTLAVVSPNTSLCLEVYVTPRDIGFMNIGMPVKVQVESFNYNEWGSISGTVKDISSDFLTDAQGNSFYKIKCDLSQDYLQLKNGRIGKLKKGMNANVHFMITKRSLFDLLYQNIDNWMNPKQNINEKLTANIN